MEESPTPDQLADALCADPLARSMQEQEAIRWLIDALQDGATIVYPDAATALEFLSGVCAWHATEDVRRGRGEVEPVECVCSERRVRLVDPEPYQP